MSGPKTGEHPLPERPTEELPESGAGGGDGRANERRSRPGTARRLAYGQIAAEVRNHRRASRSGAVPITAADRRLYERLDRLDQPN